ncbi:MAG TPA: 50S ribosomal protein L21 [Candidatus Binatia bacterium]|nr:50S ribosomal protein L21 [Candidatus Binatia bacterium]
MYAVVDSGGKQYRVEPGRTLVLDRLDAEAGATVTFDRVLLIGDEDSVTVGTPTVSGASVRGTVMEHGRGPKVIVFRFRPKAHYRRRTGHRSELTRVRIDEIATAGSAAARPAAARTSKPAAEPETSAHPKAAPRKAAVSKAAASKAAAGDKTSAKPKASAESKAAPRKAAASRKTKAQSE